MARTSYRDRVIWITGASSGIGEALAHGFSKRGARLVLSSNEEEELKRVAKDLGRPPAEVLVLPLDLLDADSMGGRTQCVIDHFGRIDMLVNNGGISQRALALDTPLELDRRIMEINYFGHIALTKAVLPHMVGQKSGHIVVTTSVMGVLSAGLRTAYCAAKHALHGFFDALRTEVWKDNIEVTLLCPAAVRTGISASALTSEGKTFGRMDKTVASGITPEEAARQIIKALEQGKEEVVIGRGLGKYGILLKRFMPAIYSQIVRRMEI